MKRFLSAVITLLIVPSFVFIFVGIIVYFTSTSFTLVQDNPVTIIASKLGENRNTIDFQFLPISTAKSDITYLLKVDNGFYKQEFKISWNQLELNIDKIKTVTKTLSTDEVTAIQRRPNYVLVVYEIKHNRPILWIICPIVAFTLLWVLSSKTRSNISPKPTINTISPINDKPPPKPKPKKIQKILLKCLRAMDKTHKWYVDENEANRELVSILNSHKYKATYQYPLENGQIADAFTKNSIIEGKLCPTKSDVDRLIVQVTDYSTTPYDIHIVIYGRVENDYQLRRIKQLVINNPKRVFLTYFPGLRIRHSTQEEE
jgi:hypothetical protein